MTKWENLPDFMRNKETEEYYKLLEKKKASLVLKRCFDVLCSLIMIVILLPVLLLVSLWIKIDSNGPVFYRQERITKNGKIFRIFKFRTMVVNADKIGTLVTLDNDNRITKVGEKIRSLRIDELPQLFNVFTGDMSFVGTRPEVKKYVDCYTEEMMATLLVPAGVTSLASIKFKDEDKMLEEYKKSGMSVDDIYVEKILPEKMRYNLKEIQNFSFFSDIKTLFYTIVAVLS